VHAVIRRYRVTPANADEIIRRAERGFIPLISAARGFVSYRIAVAADGDLMTLSLFEDQAGAEESVRMAAGWVRANLAELLPDPPEIISGHVLRREIDPTQELRHGVMRLYRRTRDHDEAMRRIRAGFEHLIRATPGFAAALVLDAGGGTIVSLTGFRDAASAEESSRKAVAWVKENLADMAPNPPEVTRMEVRAGRVAQATTA
jgi:hypothetical protein